MSRPADLVQGTLDLLVLKIIALEPQQVETVTKVSGYFNRLENLRGTFVQTAADNKRMRGTFFVKRPGRLRFEYNRPSRQLIVSDGKMLAIQDLDIQTDDRIALDQTPFRLLLRKDVDLLRAEVHDAGSHRQHFTSSTLGMTVALHKSS